MAVEAYGVGKLVMFLNFKMLMSDERLQNKFLKINGMKSGVIDFF